MHAVPDLPVCDEERAVPQCCVADFIRERLNITEEDFLEGLRDQLRERFQDFQDIAVSLRQCELTCMHASIRSKIMTCTSWYMHTHSCRKMDMQYAYRYIHTCIHTYTQ